MVFSFLARLGMLGSVRSLQLAPLRLLCCFLSSDPLLGSAPLALLARSHDSGRAKLPHAHPTVPPRVAARRTSLPATGRRSRRLPRVTQSRQRSFHSGYPRSLYRSTYLNPPSIHLPFLSLLLSGCLLFLLPLVRRNRAPTSNAPVKFA